MVTVCAQAPASAAHAHIGHVMTSWKDTPEAKGFLPTAIGDTQIAMEQVERADLEGRINDFWLYGGYVLNALDPGPETNAILKTAYARLPTTYVKVEVPGSGYGVKRAVAGALQHVQLAAKSEGASENVKTHAAHVTWQAEYLHESHSKSVTSRRPDRPCDDRNRRGRRR